MNLLLLRISYALLLFVGITGLFSLAPPDVHPLSSFSIFRFILQYASYHLLLVFPFRGCTPPVCPPVHRKQSVVAVVTR